MESKTCTRALLVALKAPDPYRGNGTLFSSGWGRITLTERGVNWFQVGEAKEGGKQNERQGAIKDTGKLPSGAGVCLTTGCTSALHTLGKRGPARAGPSDYEKTNQAYNGKHTEGRLFARVCVCVCHIVHSYSGRIDPFSILGNIKAGFQDGFRLQILSLDHVAGSDQTL